MGRRKFGGIGFMALPYDAQALPRRESGLHRRRPRSICLYILLYTLAGVISQAS